MRTKKTVTELLLVDDDTMLVRRATERWIKELDGFLKELLEK